MLRRFPGSFPGNVKDTRQTGASSSQNMRSSASEVFREIKFAASSAARNGNQFRLEMKVLHNIDGVAVFIKFQILAKQRFADLKSRRDNSVTIHSPPTLALLNVERAHGLWLGYWIGAGDRDRTGDIQLGKLTFYH